ncbi:ESX secretion-associated protein EspG [Nocardia cyriacigeorgica]|uniref:ESX secretion-associated protein EspG n=1 Tax=Nocardia cyriacigeorgica TaxID=135487 RepID=UPI001895E558|nr:ESX secretion-associated protein EspG [Nocardia cyriacigeorgica]MBF6416860.1 ESX secretion-associated protein EspG [Nocardia cyriacigeorgica]
MPTWTFDDPEDFAALWFGPANDPMLYPLDYLSRYTHVNERDEHWARSRHDWSDKGRLSWDEADSLTAAFTVLTDPQIWIEVHGNSNATGPVRIAAARNGRRAARAVQVIDHQRIKLSLFSSDRLPSALTKPLPACPPGKAQPERFDTADLDLHNQPVVRYTGEPTPLERYTQLLRRPATGAGLITVFRGPRHNGPTPHRKVGTIRWFDIKADGRYLETGIRTRTVQPATTVAMQETISRLIGYADTEYREYIDSLGEFTH